ncbi:MAG: hypothetical protein WB798_03570, partial [Nocardioidaceae bacterium]
VELPGGEEDDISQSVYLPEKDTGIEGEDRGAIDELGVHNDMDADFGVDEELGDEPGADTPGGQGGEDAVTLPEGLWRDELTGTLHEAAEVRCGDVFASYPVALLRREVLS